MKTRVVTYRKEIKWTPEYERVYARLRAARPEVKAARRLRRKTQVGMAPHARLESLDAFEGWCQRQEDRLQGSPDPDSDAQVNTLDPTSAPEMYDYEKR